MPAKKTAPRVAPAVEEAKKPAIIKKFKGVVVSSKGDKTIVVNVETVKVHPKYKKRYVVSRHYKVHDEKNEYREGDQVTFIECRPLSRDKRWRAVKQAK